MKDELLKDFGERTTPSDVSALPRQGGDPRAMSNWENVPRLPAQQYAHPPTTLPEQVSAREIADQSLARAHNVIEGGGE